MTVTQIAGASVWEQELYDHVGGHVEAEADILREYQRLADDQDRSPAFRYLARLILDDEARHHRTFNDLTEAIRQMGELRDEDQPIPALRGLRKDRDRVIETTNRLLDVEQTDAKQLKDLTKHLKDVKDTTLWVLLVELMRDDTDKHIRILRFIRDHA
jgi:bacterioferritin (cytochrome b1)